MTRKYTLTDMVKEAGGFGVGKSIGTAINGLGITGVGLAAALIGGAIVDDIGDVLKNKYTEEAKPAWQMAGQHALMNDSGDLYRSTRVQQMLYNMAFDSPERMTQAAGMEAGKNLVSGISSYGKPSVTADSLVQAMSTTPEVKAVGKRQARALMQEVTALAPNVVAASPSVTLPILQTAIDSGSMSLRPEMVKTLTDAEAKFTR